MTRPPIVSLGIVTCLLLSSAQQAGAQATYTLKPTPKTVAWGHYDAKAMPVFCPSHK